MKESDKSKYNYITINKCPYKLNMTEINFYMTTIYSSLIIYKYELSICLNYECHDNIYINKINNDLKNNNNIIN